MQVRSGTWRAAACRLLAVASLAGPMMLAPAPAAAQGTPAETRSGVRSSPAEPTVAELKQKANEAMVSLRPADALEGYRRAYEMSHEPALLYNMGHALEALQDYPGALAEYGEFGRKAPADLKARVRIDELIAETRLKVTSVSFTSTVAGARVLFRDKSLGTIPASGHLDVTLNAGPGHVEIDAEGYRTFVRDVQLPGGGILSVDAELVATDRAGVLVVTTRPEGGEVTVDGKALGAAPVEASVAAGMHAVGVRRHGFQPMESSVVVAARERKVVDITLEDTPLIVSRWWFWTGVALVVAGGIAVTAAALTERAPDHGTIQPGVQRVLSFTF